MKKKIEEEVKIETPNAPDVPQKTDDEIELEALKFIRDELNKRDIHDIGTLDRVISRIPRH